MEIQCKERVDLLEALKLSRLESKAATEEDTTRATSSNGKLSNGHEKKKRRKSDSDQTEKGWIGDGTIPAIGFPDLPCAKPPLPHRPALLPKNSSEYAVVGRNVSSSSGFLASSSRAASLSNPSLPSQSKEKSRSPSPNPGKGRSMLTTLRSGKGERKTTLRSPPLSEAPKVDRPVPSKAATLAWNSIGKVGRDGLGRSLEPEVSNSTSTIDSTRRGSYDRPRSSNPEIHYDRMTRKLVNSQPKAENPVELLTGRLEHYNLKDRNNGYPFPPIEAGRRGTVAASPLGPAAVNDLVDLDRLEVYPEASVKRSYYDGGRRSPAKAETRDDKKSSEPGVSRKPVANSSSPRHRDRHMDRDEARRAQRRESRKPKDEDLSSHNLDFDTHGSAVRRSRSKRKNQKQKEDPILAESASPSDDSESGVGEPVKTAWEAKVAHLMKNLPRGVDDAAAKQIFNEIVVQGDEVHWDDVAGLEMAKSALKEAVVYPFLRPDLFMGLREPARGMLLFGPPGTGKTMLARAVATESRSTFFSISASSLTSKYLGESEKLVRALFGLAKALAPSIIFVDEIDSLLSSRSGSGEHEATRRIKTEFLIQWSDLQRAAAGREQTEKEKEKGDASRVLVLAATNLPWAIDDAARRRFVRRQYIPLPEDETRAAQLRRLLGHQKHDLDERDIQRLVESTDGKRFNLNYLPNIKT